MILNEKQLESAVTEKFGIQNKDCDFSAKVLNLYCRQNCGSFVMGDTYNLWFGNLQVDGVRKYFACQIDGEVEEVSENVFKVKKEVLDFMHTDGLLYAVIYNSLGFCQIIPTWRLDLIKVERNGSFAAKYQKITGKFEHVGNGKENFFAWVFYAEGNVLKIFNIESGEWLDPSAAIVRLSLAGKQIINNVGLSYEHDFILCSRVVNIVE